MGALFAFIRMSLKGIFFGRAGFVPLPSGHALYPSASCGDVASVPHANFTRASNCQLTIMPDRDNSVSARIANRYKTNFLHSPDRAGILL